jgi:uncharacterized protein
MKSATSILIEFVYATWTMTGQMAPYLLFGFFAAGILSVWLKPSFVERHLGQPGLKQVLKAAAIGVPMPLCSCGVIPVTASLRRHGAGKGAAASFLASTPQTGVDSIAATWALMGWLFTVVRITAAFVTGIVAGLGVEKFDPDSAPPEQTDAENEKPGCCGGRRAHPVRRALSHGFLTLPRDIGTSLIVGLLISGAVSALVPEDFFAGKLGNSIWSLPLMAAVAIPVYVCSTGSIPVAFALIHAGISPGGALVFLIAGPATNAATISTMWNVMGKRSTLVYIASILACSLAAGWIMNRLPAPDLAAASAAHAMGRAAWFHHASAVALIAVLANALRLRR